MTYQGRSRKYKYANKHTKSRSRRKKRRKKRRRKEEEKEATGFLGTPPYGARFAYR